MKILTSLVLLALSNGTALASPRPVVVELFTSQACSDCPPADALLKHVQAQDPDVLALDLHVTYWNGAAWTDPYSLQSATDLQNFYATLRNTSEVYTPQAVVDGRQQFVGSDSGAMKTAVDQAKARIAASGAIPVSVKGGTGGLAVHVGAGQSKGTVWLIGYDPEHDTRVLGGENGGATLSEVNVVRSITGLGDWTGQAMAFSVQPPAGSKFAVLLQKQDGTILGAASD